MACRVLGSVLPFAVRMRAGFLCNLCTVLSSAAAVRVYILNADGDRVPETKQSADLVRAKFSHNHRTVPNIQLHAVRIHSQPHRKRERPTQPCRSVIRTEVGENWNHSGARYRSIPNHLQPPHRLRARLSNPGTVVSSYRRPPPTRASKSSSPQTTPLPCDSSIPRQRHPHRISKLSAPAPPSTTLPASRSAAKNLRSRACPCFSGCHPAGSASSLAFACS